MPELPFHRQGTTGPPWSQVRTARRDLLRAGAAAAGAAAFVLGAPNPARAASGDPRSGGRLSDGQRSGGQRAGQCEEFDEFYRGRHIVGRCTHEARKGATGHGGAHPGVRVFVDGEELHLMENADGTFVSIVNHFEPAPTPHSLARLAVDDLAGAELLPPPPPGPPPAR
ncbi:tyrosinase family oxidase copper chaperone [Streptomyces sp. ODS28]|uniref:tyrosinase family oxidase copper chaperone n=1 Tax=Streptomyces sp. ODS28 TaxID=3136688 RepID=UPI0031EA5777